MILFPAIDLKDGACVRLWRGDMKRATVFSHDPAAQARAFAEAGCEWLHVVDLDGAFAGAPVNRPAVEAIVAAIDAPVQLGGGIRDMATLETWLAAGVRRVVLGTAAARDPAFLDEACRRYPGQVAVGIDARRDRVAVEGWSATVTMTAQELAKRAEDAGAAAIIYTDIARDGTLQGPNVAATRDLAAAISTPVIASGGVATLGDLAALKTVEHAGVTGVIVGRAFYEGRVDPHEALTLLAA